MRARSTIMGWQLGAGALEHVGAQQLAQINRFPIVVGQLDADGAGARYDGDADGYGAHRAGDVVGQADHAAGLGAGRRLQLVAGHHRAGSDLDDLALDAEVVEHGFQQAGILLQRVALQRPTFGGRRRLGQKRKRRQLEIALGAEVELALCRLAAALAGSHGGPLRRDQGFGGVRRLFLGLFLGRARACHRPGSAERRLGPAHRRLGPTAADVADPRGDRRPQGPKPARLAGEPGPGAEQPLPVRATDRQDDQQGGERQDAAAEGNDPCLRQELRAQPAQQQVAGEAADAAFAGPIPGSGKIGHDQRR
jgi:hypothetical protein